MKHDQDVRQDVTLALDELPAASLPEAHPHHPIVDEVQTLIDQKRSPLIAGIVVSIIVIAIVGNLTGLFQVRSFADLVDVMTVIDVGFGLFVCAVFIAIMMMEIRKYRRLLRGLAVARMANPVRQQLTVEAVDYGKASSDVPRVYWRVELRAPRAPADSPAEHTLKILATTDRDGLRAITHTIGLVYRNPSPHDPVVIQTIQGVLIAEYIIRSANGH